MKTIITLIAGFILLGGDLFAQNAHFTTSGVIEYEKSVNMFALIKREINKDNEAFLQPAYESYKKNQPQFKKLKSTLSFSDNKTEFVPIEPENIERNYLSDNAMVNQNNTTFTDLQTNTFIAEKKVFEETFLVKDSTRKISWKITDETREIAGYVCRRANAIILDSVYVVAFYTEKIPISGGPESFTGLPGMILGVALPHENITWFATKVTEMPVDNKALVPPKKGKATNKKELRKTLDGAMKDWGTWGQTYLKAFSI
ncbi:GLPGLI family protein [Mucilaginibacter sp.]|uniref:GLPGLI family protein n=1 Tax=Mucilaginibacter sp. TaxID=1882438 RepID=UPI003D0A92DC